MNAQFRIEPLGPGHDREGFDSGSPPLDRYFRTQVSQDVRRRVTTCHVAVTEAGVIAGFYTLAAGSVALNALPEAALRRLPRYPSVPVARLGRLAVDRRFQGQQLGAALLWDALQRCLPSPLAAFALVVDAKDEAAAAFYQHHGFTAFTDAPLQLFRPLATVSST